MACSLRTKKRGGGAISIQLPMAFSGGHGSSARFINLRHCPVSSLVHRDVVCDSVCPSCMMYGCAFSSPKLEIYRKLQLHFNSS